MARPKFIREASEKQDEIEVVIADHDTWLYHETEYPRIFKKGDVVPAGWNEANRKLWTFNDFGEMTKIWPR